MSVRSLALSRARAHRDCETPMMLSVVENESRGKMSMNQRILQCFDLQAHFHEAGLLNVRSKKVIRCHCDMIQLLEKRDQLALIRLLIPMKHRILAP
jgi:hypothetical protein